MDAADGASKFAWQKDGYVYTRMGNPTISILEQRMSMLEGGVGAVATASGHAAQVCSLKSDIQGASLTELLVHGHHLSYGGRLQLRQHQLVVRWNLQPVPCLHEEVQDRCQVG